MRVLVLGAGYAGATLARALESRLPDDAELAVVDETGSHCLQHEIHRLVRRPDLADELVVPLEDLLEEATVREATVTDLDRERRAVALANGDVLAYDVAAVCLGAATDDHGIPGVAAHGTPLKRVADALAIREAFLDLPEGGTAVVGGAGLSGVQVAGELAALADAERPDASVVLLEQESTVAPGFPGNFQSAVGEALADAGVDVRTDAAVVEAAADAVTLAGGATVACDHLVWTGGIRGPDALGGERPAVRGTLALDERTFVVGDAGAVVDAEGAAVPASAQAATRAARVAARNVVRVLEADEGGRPRLEQFTFDPRGWVVSVGDDYVAQVGPAVVRGRAAGALKRSVSASYLVSAGAVREAAGLLRDALD